MNTLLDLPPSCERYATAHGAVQARDLLCVVLLCWSSLHELVRCIIRRGCDAMPRGYVVASLAVQCSSLHELVRCLTTAGCGDKGLTMKERQLHITAWRTMNFLGSHMSDCQECLLNPDTPNECHVIHQHWFHCNRMELDNRSRIRGNRLN
jgi:hypothetical protein